MAFPATIALPGLNGTTGFIIGGADSNEGLGWRVAAAGDVNGDGLPDFLIGTSEQAQAYLVFGAAGGLPAFFSSPDLDGPDGVLIQGFPFAMFGESLSAGDINGDGFFDIVIGAANFQVASPNEGAAISPPASGNGGAYVIFGHAGAWGATFDVANLDGQNGFQVKGGALNSGLGWSVSMAGDINDDGFDDLFVSASNSSNPGYVVFGKAGGFAASLDVASLTGANGFKMTAVALGGTGYDFSSVGDINGDGVDDLAITGPVTAAVGRSSAGRVFVVFGKAQGLPANVDLNNLAAPDGVLIYGAAAFEGLGSAVTAAGDVNGDGIGDMIIGASGLDAPGRTNSGGAYVVFGKAGAWASTLDAGTIAGPVGFRILGPTANGLTGYHLAAAGDVNGDGFDDVIVGTERLVQGADNFAGGGFIIFGKAGGFADTIDLTTIAAAEGVRLNGVGLQSFTGQGVAGIGDVNNDGLDDVALGAIGGDWTGHTNAGLVYVVYGQSSTAATTGADTWVGTAAVDKWKALGGGDSLQGLAGNDRLDGGPGADKALYAGTAGQYDFWETADGTWRVKDLRTSSPEGTDTLISVESLQFSDKTVKILGLTTAEQLTAAYENVLRSTATGGELTFLNNLIGAVNGSTKTLSAAIGEIVAKADGTTAVAALSYQFFAGFAPSKGGFDYLVSPQGPNPNNINSAYYQSFSLENRYINFAVNLGKLGEGAAGFLSEYGSKTLFEATKSAYMEIFGGTVADSKINTILDTTFQIAGQTVSRAQYFAIYGGDGLTGIGTKAAMVGWLLTEAAKADLGMYARSSNAFLTDLADGAQTLVDLVGVYGEPDYVFNG